MTTTILTGDCRDILPTLPAGSVQCVVTSPPYFGLRDYGVSGQIGLEPTVEAFVTEMVAVFREVRRVLADDGTLWLNLGDSYANDTKWGGRTSGKHVTALHGDAGIGRRRTNTGLKSKDLIGIPWRVAFALQADGWYLRQDIIWAKPNPMPESVTDRCTKSHEYLFLLTKSARYSYDAGAIAEPTTWELSTSKMPDGWDTGSGGHGSFHRNGREKGAPASHKGSAFHRGKTAEHQLGRASEENRSGNSATRNKRSVWTIATHGFPDAHFATFPEALVEPCILAGSREGDTILDPFSGSGTTAGVANRLGRHSVAIELNPAYVPMIERRTAQQPLALETA